MQVFSETQALVRRMALVAASFFCLFLASCGSSNSPTPPPPPLGHLYTVTSNVTYGYSIAASNGNLQVLNVSGGLPGVGKYITSNGQYVYVLNGNGLITAYKINSDFTLSQIAGSPFSGAPNNVAFISVDPAGKYLFVPVPSDSAVLPYTIDATSGALTIGAEATTPATPLAATVDPQEKFVYVPMDAAGTQLFQLNGGTLVSVKTIPTLTVGKSEFVAITPDNKFAYIADGVAGVAAYSINTATGDLTAISDKAYAAGPGPSYVAITPNGKYLYAANVAAVVPFVINSDGSLNPNGNPITVGEPPLQLAIDPTGSFLYGVTVNSNLVSTFHIDSSGFLAAQAASSVPAVPNSIVTTH